MERKQFCGNCHYFERSECWCYSLNNHRKPLNHICSDYTERKC